MVDVDDIERAITGHPDTAHVNVPVSMMREIVRDYRRRGAGLAQLAAASAIGDLGQVLTR